MNVYIKLPAIIQATPDYDPDEAEKYDLMGMKYNPVTVDIESFEYVLIEGKCNLKSFYSDAEGILTAYSESHQEHIQYNITLEEFIKHMVGYIRIIE